MRFNSMKFEPGDRFDLVRLMPEGGGETTRFEISEVIPYRNTIHFIIYGSPVEHDLWLPALKDSRPNVPKRPSAFPLIETVERPGDLKDFCDGLYNWVPWAAVIGNTGVYLPNHATHKGFKVTKPSVIKEAAYLIDLWTAWQLNGRPHDMPAYYRERNRRIDGGLN